MCTQKSFAWRFITLYALGAMIKKEDIQDNPVNA